jgi:hypothetical protein
VCWLFISTKWEKRSDLRKKIETGDYMVTLNQSNVSLSELMEMRRKSANLGGVAFSSEEKKTPSRQAMDKLLEETLRKAGLDLNKVEELRKQSESEMLETMAKRTAEADKLDAAGEDMARRTIENWHNTMVQLTTLAPDGLQRFLLNTASEISSTSQISLVSKQIAPANNAAQFESHLKQTVLSGFPEEVSFGFLWQNQSDKYVFINADGYLVLTALCRASSKGGIFGGERYCELNVDANLHINGLWAQPPPPKSPPPQTDQHQNALKFRVDSGGIFDDDKTAAAHLFRGFDLRYTSLLVPPNGMVMFEVACSLWASISDGEADYTFVQFGRQAQCPGLLITLLS